MKLFLFLFLPLNLYALDIFEVIIREHKFIPEILEVPSGKKIILIINNEDNRAEEFESFDLKREKMVPGKSKININLGPLNPGEYSYFGEFHHKTAQGKIIAK